MPILYITTIVRKFIVSQFISWPQCIKMQHKIIKQWIQNYEKNNDNSNDNSNDRENYYERLKEYHKLNPTKFTKDMIVADILVSYQAGIHTTATLLLRCILYLAKCGKLYQNQLYLEIKNIENKNKNENEDITDILKNIKYLPKLTSFICEVLRSNDTTQTFPRFMEFNDFNIKFEYNNKHFEYIIPKGTQVLGNIAAINNNKNFWEKELNGFDVTYFDPERFLNENGDFIGKQQLSSFGAGYRSCAGQELAKREIYLVISMLISKYEFTMPHNNENNKQPKNNFVVPRIDTRNIGDPKSSVWEVDVNHRKLFQ